MQTFLVIFVMSAACTGGYRRRRSTVTKTLNNITVASTERYRERRIATHDGILKRDHAFINVFTNTASTPPLREAYEKPFHFIYTDKMALGLWKAFFVILFLLFDNVIGNVPADANVLHLALFAFSTPAQTSVVIVGSKSCCRQGNN